RPRPQLKEREGGIALQEAALLEAPQSLTARQRETEALEVLAGLLNSRLTFQLLEPLTWRNHDRGEKDASTRLSGGGPGNGPVWLARAGADGRHVGHGFHAGHGRPRGP